MIDWLIGWLVDALMDHRILYYQAAASWGGVIGVVQIFLEHAGLMKNEAARRKQTAHPSFFTPKIMHGSCAICIPYYSHPNTMQRCAETGNTMPCCCHVLL